MNFKNRCYIGAFIVWALLVLASPGFCQQNLPPVHVDGDFNYTGVNVFGTEVLNATAGISTFVLDVTEQITADALVVGSTASVVDQIKIGDATQNFGLNTQLVIWKDSGLATAVIYTNGNSDAFLELASDYDGDYRNVGIGMFYTRDQLRLWNDPTGISAGQFIISNNGDVSISQVLNASGGMNGDLFMDRLGSSALRYAQDWSDQTQSAGIIYGGTITDSGSGEIDVAAGGGFIKTSNSAHGNTLFFEWAADTNIGLTSGSMNYVYIDYAAGSPAVATTTTQSDINHHDEIGLGRIYRYADTLKILSGGVAVDDLSYRTHSRLSSVEGFVRASGIVTTVTGTRQLQITAGTFWNGLTKLNTTAFDSGTFTYKYRDGGTAWTTVAGVTQIDNTYYDDDSGSLAALTVNQYGVYWVYWCAGTEDYFVVYGQDSYKLVAAELAEVPSSLPPCLTEMGLLIAKIIIKKDDSFFTEVILPWDSTIEGSSPTDHNELAGLQGGTVGEYYHLTSSEQTELSSWLDDVVLGSDGSIQSDGELYLTYSVSPNSQGLKLWHDTNVGSSYIDNIHDNAASDIYFRTRVAGTPVNVMSLGGDGNVGIGTDSPLVDLDARGDNAKAGSSEDTFFTGSSDASNPLGVVIGHGGSGNYGYIQANQYALSNKNLILQPNGANVNIGGTNAPVQLLTLEPGDGGGIAFRASATNHNNQIMWTDDAGSTYQGKIYYDHSTNAMVFQTVNTTQLLIDSSGNVGIGASSPNSTLHVVTAGSGSGNPGANSDDLIVENNGNTGLTLLSTDATQSQIQFGSPTDVLGALIRWNHDADLMTFGPANTGGELSITSGNSAEAIRIDSSGNVAIEEVLNVTDKITTPYIKMYDTEPLIDLYRTSGTKEVKLKLRTGSRWDEIVNTTAGLEIRVNTSGAEKVVRFDSSGNVTIANGDLHMGDTDENNIHGNILYATRVSAVTFTDRTPMPPEGYDALTAINNIKDDGHGGIDHSTLGLARVTRNVTDTFTDIKRKDGTLLKRVKGTVPTVKKARTKIEYVTEEYTIYGEDGHITKGVRDVTNEIQITKEITEQKRKTYYTYAATDLTPNSADYLPTVTYMSENRIADAKLVSATWEMVDVTRSILVPDEDISIRTFLDKNAIRENIEDVKLVTVKEMRVEEGRSLGDMISVFTRGCHQIIKWMEIQEQKDVEQDQRIQILEETVYDLQERLAKLEAVK